MPADRQIAGTDGDNKVYDRGFTEFEITFFVEDLGQSANAQNKLFDCIFRHLFLSDVRLVSAQDQSSCDGQGPRQPLPEAERRNALFLIGRGVLSATRDAIEGEIELERFGPGDHYGEIGMLTGSPSIAKIAALTPAVVYELAKDDLTPILEAFPQVAEKLSCALAQRRAASCLDAETGLGETLPTKALTAWFSERLHRLYGVAGAAQ